VAPAFYWIPNATISALVIHAVADLVASPKQSFAFWRVSPFEYIIFVGAVLWSIFYTIESGIYWSLVTSVVLLLFRIARPRGHFLGRVRVPPPKSAEAGQVRDVYIPLDSDDGNSNAEVHVEAPPPGVVIYRFEESFLYPNASYINDRLVDYVKERTRRGKDYSNISTGDRPWNDPGPKPKDAKAVLEAEAAKPRLRAVILDFSAVANLDTTGVQNLIDTRKEVEKWADRPVQFHFAGILSPWIKRALIAGGFGRDSLSQARSVEVAPVVAYDNAINPTDKDRQTIGHASGSGESSGAPSFIEKDVAEDEEARHLAQVSDGSAVRPRRVSQASSSTFLFDQATPFFHFDLQDALHSLDLSKGLD